MTASTRIALKLAYIGDRYHGFQIQPNVRTVESEIFVSLKKSGIVNDIKEARYKRASRTDRGVHASGQVVAFDTGAEFGDSFPRIINSNLPDDIWVWAHAEVPDDFDPRRDAIRREYRYFLYNRGYDLTIMRESSHLFIGTHDFSNFTKEREDTVRIIDTIDIQEKNNLIIVDITAPSFLWNMVRRIAAALEQIGCGTRNQDWLSDLLDPAHHSQGIKPAPAYGLVLRNIVYREIVWIEDEYSKRRMKKAFMNAMVWHATMKEVLHSGL